MPDEEQWKPVEGYEGLYEVSSFGRARSLDREVKRGTDAKWSMPGRMLSFLQSEHLWPCVTLARNGKNKVVYLKKLVAEAFLPNPHRRRYLMEIDGNKANCRVDNLAWREVDSLGYVKKNGRLRRKPRPKLILSRFDLPTIVADAVWDWCAKNQHDPADAWRKMRTYPWHRISGLKKP